MSQIEVAAKAPLMLIYQAQVQVLTLFLAGLDAVEAIETTIIFEHLVHSAESGGRAR